MIELSISDHDFSRISKLIHTTWGIKMPPSKKSMLQGRLSKRLRLLGIDSLDNYCRYLFSPEGQQNELMHVIDVVSTNITDFFREPNSFVHLIRQALPELTVKNGAGIRNTFMVWSAGCSSGEEPYTIAMFMEEFSQNYPGLMFDYFVLATDISISALDKAKRAVYPHDRADAIPMELRRKYLLRSRNADKDMIRIRPELRGRVGFRQLNLMEDFGFRELMDVIFCRNVIIYFDRQTRERLFMRFCGQLKPNGYIYIGHSESLQGMDLPLQQVAPTIYRKVETI